MRTLSFEETMQVSGGMFIVQTNDDLFGPSIGDSMVGGWPMGQPYFSWENSEDDPAKPSEGESLGKFCEKAEEVKDFCSTLALLTAPAGGTPPGKAALAVCAAASGGAHLYQLAYCR